MIMDRPSIFKPLKCSPENGECSKGLRKKLPWGLCVLPMQCPVRRSGFEKVKERGFSPLHHTLHRLQNEPTHARSHTFPTHQTVLLTGRAALVSCFRYRLSTSYPSESEQSSQTSDPGKWDSILETIPSALCSYRSSSGERR